MAHPNVTKAREDMLDAAIELNSAMARFSAAAIEVATSTNIYPHPDTVQKAMDTADEVKAAGKSYIDAYKAVEFFEES